MKKVSVWMITYNHEKYIKDALDGVLSQKTDFDWEVIISDDASTDSTPKILQNYKKKYPHKLKLFLHKKNMGFMKNMRFTLQQCNGTYVAMCEGDDYWTDAKKLQKQTDFLDTNLDYSLTSHNVLLLNQSIGEATPLWKKPVSSIYSFKDSLKYGSGAATCSLFFRRSILQDYPQWFDKCNSGDWPTQLCCLENGLMHRSNQIMGVYRRHSQGSLAHAVNLEYSKGNHDTMGLQYIYMLDTFNVVDEVYKHKYSNLLDFQRKSAYKDLILLCFLNHNFTKAKKYQRELFRHVGYPVDSTLTIHIILLALFLPKNILKKLISLKQSLYAKS